MSGQLSHFPHWKWNKLCLLLLLSEVSTLTGEKCNISTASTAVTHWNRVEQMVRHNTSTAFTETHYYQFCQETKVAQKTGPANILQKAATHTRYKTTTCIRYCTTQTSTKNTKLSNTYMQPIWYSLSSWPHSDITSLGHSVTCTSFSLPFLQQKCFWDRLSGQECVLKFMCNFDSLCMAVSVYHTYHKERKHFIIKLWILWLVSSSTYSDVFYN